MCFLSLSPVYLPLFWFDVFPDPSVHSFCECSPCLTSGLALPVSSIYRALLIHAFLPLSHLAFNILHGGRSHLAPRRFRTSQQEIHIQDPFVELIGKVNDDLTVKALTLMNIGSDFGELVSSDGRSSMRLRTETDLAVLCCVVWCCCHRPGSG